MPQPIDHTDVIITSGHEASVRMTLEIIKEATSFRVASHTETPQWSPFNPSVLTTNRQLADSNNVDIRAQLQIRVHAETRFFYDPPDSGTPDLVATAPTWQTNRNTPEGWLVEVQVSLEAEHNGTILTAQILGDDDRYRITIREGSTEIARGEITFHALPPTSP